MVDSVSAEDVSDWPREISKGAGERDTITLEASTDGDDFVLHVTQRQEALPSDDYEAEVSAAGAFVRFGLVEIESYLNEESARKLHAALEEFFALPDEAVKEHG